jgi:hypothetical protein
MAQIRNDGGNMGQEEKLKKIDNMKTGGFLKRIFMSNSGVSSKRIFGALGWLICLGLAIYCAIETKETPTIVMDIVYASTALLGLDTVTGIWKVAKGGKSEES